MKVNKIFILSAPSGAGKTTVMKGIMENVPNTNFLPSTTTRQIRNGEVNGIDYNFISVEDFKRMVENNEFIEHEEVYPNEFYGTPKVTKCDGITIMIKDVLGGISLKKFYGDDCTTIFIRPPSIKVLEERLRERGSEPEDKLRKRIDRAEYEMTFEDKYDYSILNDELDDCLNVVCSLIRTNFF